MDTTLIDTLVVAVDTVAACCPPEIATETTEVMEETGFVDFILANWGELLIGLMAFIKIIVNITPTTTDNKVFGWLDSLINMIISDRIKKDNA